MAQKRDEQAQSVWERRWREHIEQWRRSGQSQRAYCQAQGISDSSLSRWKCELGRRDLFRSQAAALDKAAEGDGVRDRTAESMRWTEVHLPAAGGAVAPIARDAGFEVVLPRGWSVRLGSRFEADSLRRLLAVLEALPC